ncbi:hypothetical protein [Anaerovorax odorimutans]|uniref:hypothetical protein n=1 Tax=Anaerovorax odorimutans TaxID=109327 RepID=UPI0003FA0DE1|nr:hypothetical protein [Anaerovorax odorimutans]
MKKTIIFMLITLMLMMTFVGCGNGNQEEENLTSVGEQNALSRSDNGDTGDVASQNDNVGTAGIADFVDYCGVYTTTSNENGDSIEVAETDTDGTVMYKISSINILSEVYRNVEIQDYSAVFSDDDIASGTVDITTNFGCTGTITFNGNGTVSLHLECNDAVYDSDFARQ